jgi:hypothetical protein
MRGAGEIAQFNGMYYPDKRAIVDQEKEFTWGRRELLRKASLCI